MRWVPLLALGCAGDRSGDTAAPGDPFCADAPARVTWETFGDAFFTENCQTCHSGALPAEARSQAPLDVTFDTEEEVLRFASAILSQATGDDPRMPPEGGVSEEDRHLLEVWLRCGG